MSLLILLGGGVAFAATNDPVHVVQFVVHADEETDVAHLFMGAYIDFTWNNVFVVSIWTNDPKPLMLSVQETLTSNSDKLQVLIPPYTIEASTQKWLQYNLVWVATLVLVFTAGCLCGGMVIYQCFDARRAMMHDSRRRRQPSVFDCII